MYFALPAESMETTCEGSASTAPTEMDGHFPALESKLLASDESNRTAILTTAPTSGDDEEREEPPTDGMEIDDLPQEQASHIIMTTDLIVKAQEQVSLLQALRAVRDRLLATLGVKDLESPPRSAAKTASEPPAHNGSWTVETESQDGPVEGPVQGLAFTNRPDSSDRLWLSDDTSEVRAWIDAHPVQYKQTPRHNLLSDSLDQLTLEDSARLPPEPLPCSLKEDQPDATFVDSERGRSRKRQSAVQRQKAKGPSPLRRRPASPDWNVVLGEPDPSFVPDHGFFCSRCLRRVPEANRRHTAKQVSAVENEYKFHMAQDRCCRIRHGIGCAHKLPNRSGWIPAAEAEGLNLELLKARFLAAHPAYAPTLYPVLPSDARNLWRSDPNNASNSPHWALPWPPHVDHRLPPVPEGSEEGPAAARSGCAGSAKKRGADASYCYETDTSSDDGLSGRGVDVMRMPRRKKRRRLGDASYRPRRGGCGIVSDDDDELAGGGAAAPERLRHELEQEMRSMREQ
ncbi:hypothetical protein A9K55_005232 [Cordyceps militaris]|uniref:Uncharacterized protein n=1 Tax=Cordyceps militaris TaxID=73501 RepID=A0A2H4SP88_CORMI|nr:hypothetical protein A9K55_005232 [Cordyceps militaris]